ncbi:MAG: helix-turn-helix domain-containing protein [Betaproteobacteria bacterium]
MDRSISSFGEAQLRALGARLRELREARRWSLKRLSGEANVSIAALQAIEAGGSNPGLLTIVSLAEALGEPVDRLIAASRAASSTVRVVHGRLARRTAGVQQLTGDLHRPRMRSWVVSVPARRSIRKLPAGARPPLFAFVLEGKLRLTFDGGGSETLAKGDTINLNAELPAQWANPGSSAARALCVADNRDHDD